MINSATDNFPMTDQSSRRSKITEENLIEAAALKRIWEDSKSWRAEAGIGSQAAFGTEFDIGNQSAVGFFLNGQTPLSMKAAKGFARGLRCQISDFSSRLATEAATLADLSGAKTGSAGKGSPIDLAHELSQPHQTLRPQLVWGDLKKMKLPTEFRVAMPDDAMGARAPKGCVLTFSTTEKPRYGDGILVRTRENEVFFRLYQQGIDGWEARAINPAFVSLESGTHGLEIVGVMIEGGPRWA